MALSPEEVDGRYFPQSTFGRILAAALSLLTPGSTIFVQPGNALTVRPDNGGTLRILPSHSLDGEGVVTATGAAQPLLDRLFTPPN